MRLPKGKALALLMLATAIGLVAATGAFTSVSAQRTATVDVAADSQAYLAMSANSSSPNGAQYVSESGQGQVVIDIADSSVGGQGVNVNSKTTFDHLVTITNQGTQDVNVDIASVTGTNSAAVTFYYGTTNVTGQAPSGTVLNGNNPKTLSPGQSMSVGMRIDTSSITGTGVQADAISVTATIEANAVRPQTTTP